jgi:predicted Co/Zn/Cd cation transporter (cation efflux family)
LHYVVIVTLIVTVIVAVVGIIVGIIVGSGWLLCRLRGLVDIAHDC